MFHRPVSQFFDNFPRSCLLFCLLFFCSCLTVLLALPGSYLARFLQRLNLVSGNFAKCESSGWVCLVLTSSGKHKVWRSLFYLPWQRPPWLQPEVFIGYFSQYKLPSISVTIIIFLYWLILNMSATVREDTFKTGEFVHDFSLSINITAKMIEVFELTHFKR